VAAQPEPGEDGPLSEPHDPDVQRPPHGEDAPGPGADGSAFVPEAPPEQARPDGSAVVPESPPGDAPPGPEPPVPPPGEPRPPREPAPWEPAATPASEWRPEPPREPAPWERALPPPPVPPEPREPPPWEPGGPEPAAEPPSRREPPKRGLNPLVRLGVPQPWRTIIDWIVTIAGAILIVLAIKAWVVNPYRIPSSSMEPTLHCARPGSLCTARFSDRVLACRFCYRFTSPKRGDIVVFNVPSRAEEACGAGGVFVKRIIGLPGDVWQEKDGYVYINGKRLVEPYIKPERRDFQSYPARRIPKGRYFMMGDNRQSSCDSRRWGTVPRGNIIGKVFAIYWPPQRIRIV
jgi:signal peptidase I